MGRLISNPNQPLRGHLEAYNFAHSTTVIAVFEMCEAYQDWCEL